MKHFFISILLIALLSCHNKPKPSVIVGIDTVNEENKTMIDSSTGLWQQYKKQGIMPGDTIADRDCFIRIDADSFYYIIGETVQYADLLVKDNEYKFPVYGFKNRYQDKLHVLDDGFRQLQLRKYANEGDYEYFIRVSNGAKP